MPKWALLLLLAGAATQVSVKDLEQTLAADRGKKDADLARELADMELTERAGSARLLQWQADLPGDKSRQALIALVDSSAFLAPPTDEIPATPAPDAAEQRRIMAAAVDYVGKIIPRSPDFMAIRDTVRYQDTPIGYRTQLAQTGKYQPLELFDRSSETVLVRDGKEVVDPNAAQATPPQAGAAKGATAKNASAARPKRGGMVAGLTTWGEFGPILGLVLVDAAKSQLAWSRWETGAAGPLAVFHFEVPQEKSRYEVRWCCVTDFANLRSVTMHVFHQFTGYHGEMAIDAATGAILRLTLEADLKKDAPLGRAAMAIEYAPVEIGGQIYICPVKSISISRAPAQLVIRIQNGFGNAPPGVDSPKRTWVNDIHYGQYHLFRGEVHMLAGDAAEGGESAPAIAQKGGEQAAAAAEADAANLDQPIVVPLEPAAPGATSSVSIASSGLEAHIAVSAGVGADEIAVADAGGLPDSPPQPQPEDGFTLNAASRAIDITVIALDKQGHRITDLKREDLEIDDGGDAQTIQSLSTPAVASDSTAATAQARSEASPAVFSSRPQEDQETEARGATVLLLDPAGLEFADLERVREQILRFLKTLPAAEPVGLYAAKPQGFAILAEATASHDQFAAALSAWLPTDAEFAKAQAETRRAAQPAGQSSSGVSGAAPGTNPAGAEAGEAVETAFIPLTAVARHLAEFPGHKSLVRIGGHEASEAPAAPRNKHDPRVQLVAGVTLLAQETMNTAHVSFYPYDAGKPEATAPAQHKSGNAPLLSPMGEAAEATAGSDLGQDGDLAARLAGVVEDGHAACVLRFTPDVPADGEYHPLQLKLLARRDLTLRFRAGYSYDRTPDSLKERFRQAVWETDDAAAIAVSATPAADERGTMLKLKIDTSDLDLSGAPGPSETGTAPEAAPQAGRVDVFLVERSDETQHAQVTGQSLTLRLKQPAFERLLRDGIPLDQPVALKPETTSVRVIVVDENSGRLGSVTIPAAAFPAAKTH